MKSLIYLLVTQAKNWLKELLRKPGRLILYLLMVGGIGGVLLLSRFTDDAVDLAAPLFWLRGIYFAFLALFFALSVQKGLTSGDTIFDMSDVNLLFVSPVNPRATLLYGLVRLTKISFLAGFFILFQSNSLTYFGVRFGGILVLFGVFILAMVALSLLSLVIYSFTNGRPGRKNAVKVVSAALFVPLLAYFAFLAAGGDVLGALEAALTSPLLAAVPFAGWAAACALNFLAGQWLFGLAWMGLLLLGAAGLFLCLMLGRVDYYEDVLVATETAFEKKRALAEGNVNAAASSTRKVKVNRTGLSGRGAAVFFYKHLREAFRQSRFGFFGLYTVIMFLCATVLAVFLRGEMNVVFFLILLMWMQILMIGNGRGMRELYTHYIYMAPQPPFKKVVWSNMELVFKTLLESVLLLGVPGLVLGGGPVLILACMAVYTLFSMLLVGVNYLFMRWTGANLSAGILLSLYFGAVIVIMLPGAAAAVIVGLVLVGGSAGTLLALLILALWQLLAALGCFALSKSVLHNCDMPNLRPMQK